MTSVNASKRLALTLAELLITIAFMAILVSLLLPAVQSFREASNRMTCVNHLKDIGLAFHKFHETNDYLPDGGKNQCDLPYHPFMKLSERERCDEAQLDPDDPHGRNAPYSPVGSRDVRRSEWSWPYQILPFIEQSQLYQTESDAVVIATPLKAYHCPSRRRPQPFAKHATIDYAGCAGSNGVNGMVIRQGTGPIGFSHVLDGLANTVMVGEKRLKLDRLGVSYDDDESWANPGWDTDIYRQAATDVDRPDGDFGPSPDVPISHPAVFGDLYDGLEQFGSSHLKGINVVMGDGAVRWCTFTPIRRPFVPIACGTTAARSIPMTSDIGSETESIHFFFGSSFLGSSPGG